MPVIASHEIATLQSCHPSPSPVTIGTANGWRALRPSPRVLQGGCVSKHRLIARP